MDESLPQNSQSKKSTLSSFIEFSTEEIIFLTFLVFIVLSTFNYFNILPLSKMFPRVFGILPHQTSKSEIKVIIPTFPATNYSREKDTLLPLSPSHPLVQLANLDYGLRGTLKEIKKQDKSYLLVLTEPLSKNFPPLLINADTPIIHRTAKKVEELTVDDLKRGSEIFVSVLFDLKKNTSTVTGVDVLKL